MPIDIGLLREDTGGDPEKVRESQRRRFASVELVDEVIEMDQRWRNMKFELDEARKRKNALNKEIGQLRRNKEVESDEMRNEKKELEERVGSLEVEVVELKAEIDFKLNQIGNVVDDSGLMKII